MEEERYYTIEEIEDLVYAAATMDCEGTITLKSQVSKSSGRRSFNSYIYVTNTDVRLMDWFRTKYGGSVYTLPSQGANYKPVLRWALWGSRAASFIEYIRPYLKLKQEQADIVISFQNLRSVFHTCQRVPLSEEFIEEATVLKEAVAILNKKGMQ